MLDQVAIIPMVWAEDTENQGSMNHCAACGRKIKGDPKHWVECCDDGDSVAAPGLGIDPNDSFGFFPVGPECARRYFKGFTHNH